MKKLKLLFTLVLLALLTTNCEKDDLCAEDVTTPMIVLEFYNNSDRVLKPVTNLEVTSVGLEDSLANFNNVTKIMLPLKTTEDFTEYKMILFSTDEVRQNEVILRFNYARNDVYVSRACGFKTLFQLNETTPFVLTDNTPSDVQWIRSISVEQPNIENQNETHINIYY